MKAAGGKRMFGIEVNTVLSIVALLIIVYVLFRDAKDDKTAGEVAKAAVMEVRGEVNSRSGELEELQKEVAEFKVTEGQNMEAFVKEDSRLSAELDALKLKVEALEMRPVASGTPPLIKVQPVKVQVEMIYPPRPVKVNLAPVKKGIEKAVRKAK